VIPGAVLGVGCLWAMGVVYPASMKAPLTCVTANVTRLQNGCSCQVKVPSGWAPTLDVAARLGTIASAAANGRQPGYGTEISRTYQGKLVTLRSVS